MLPAAPGHLVGELLAADRLDAPRRMGAFGPARHVSVVALDSFDGQIATSISARRQACDFG
jgi:hypothetical protein